MKKSYSIREIILGLIIMALGLIREFLVGDKIGWVIAVFGLVLFLIGIFMKRFLKWEMKKDTGADQIIEDQNGTFIEVYEENKK